MEKKITELKNTLQNCILLKKIVELSPSNVLLRIDLENNNEINSSQITKQKILQWSRILCNEEILNFFQI